MIPVLLGIKFSDPQGPVLSVIKCDFVLPYVPILIINIRDMIDA